MKHLLSVIAVAALPASAFAADINTTFDSLNTLVQKLGPFLITLAVVVFVWGLVKFIAKAHDEKAKGEGKQLMIWGMIALFVMIGFWNIIGWVQKSLGITEQATAGKPPTGVVDIFKAQ